MPIYEFYCQACNTIYKFYSKTVNTEKIPECPRCRDNKLKRVLSSFATVSARKDDNETDIPDIDGAKMEKAISMLAKEAGRINEDDPRQAATLMRKLSEATGLTMGTGMEEAMSRLEKGEDPEKIEQEMGDIINSEEPFTVSEARTHARKKVQPKRDETLYEF